MNIFKSLNNSTVYFFGGLITGVFSLLISVILPISTFATSGIITFSLIALIEESLKLVILWFIVVNSRIIKSIFNYLNIAIFFGLGFSLFELILFHYNQTYSLSYYFFANILFHIITSFILVSGICLNIKKLSTHKILLFLLAFFIHLCYNLIVLKLT